MEYRLSMPVGEEEVRRLRVGDVVYLTGRLYTLRDAGHKRAVGFLRAGRPLPVDFSGMAVYHMGPVVRREGDRWIVISAGPTTSRRIEVYEAEFIERTGARLVIGKGGMGSRTAEACERFGAAYLIFTGGAGALAGKQVEEVEGVEWLDLGIPEALWILRVRDFGPLTVIIDSTGRNLYEERAREVRENLERAYTLLG